MENLKTGVDAFFILLGAIMILAMHAGFAFLELGTVRRGGHTYHRLRVGEFRIYFEATEGSLMANYVLHKHTYADFAFRSHLPFPEDEARIEQEGGFWKYLDEPPKS